MRRREVITALAAAAAWPSAASAQQPAVPVIGYLSVGPAVTTTLAALRKGLGEQGYVEGRNLAFEFRHAEQYDRLMALADELVRRQVAVVVTAGSNNAAQAARAATTHVPIVFTTGSDPVRLGLVASLNRPGGNATGVTYLAAELGPKRLELLRELVPQAGTIAFLVNPTSSNTKLNTEDMQTAARGIAQQISISSASTASEIETAFAALARQQVGGLLINNDAFFASRPEQFVALAARHRIPTVHFAPQFTRAGGLMSYSDDRLESWRQAGIYVGRILKGEKPADLPVQRATKVELIINMQAARVLGLTIPPTLRALASEVIE